MTAGFDLRTVGDAVPYRSLDRTFHAYVNHILHGAREPEVLTIQATKSRNRSTATANRVSEVPVSSRTISSETGRNQSASHPQMQSAIVSVDRHTNTQNCTPSKKKSPEADEILSTHIPSAQSTSSVESFLPGFFSKKPRTP